MAAETRFPKTTTFHGTALVDGAASGILIASDLELSFWGGINPVTGEIIDRHHPLSGQNVQNKILAIPGGRGSCGGSTIMMELLVSGKGPKAIIFERREEIITLGVMIGEEVLGKSIPVVLLNSNDFRQLLTWNEKTVHIDNGVVSDTSLQNSGLRQTNGGTYPDDSHILGIKLSSLDQEILNGDRGEAARIAMRVILRLANLMGAHELLSVQQVHIDGCLYLGPASLAVPSKYRDLGGKVQVPTTINSISVDQKRWRAQGIDIVFGEASSELAKAFTDMGAQPTFTCAPYQLDSAPKQGELICWGESNAVIYANSVLGARTLKTPDGLDYAVALTGRAPKAGAYLDVNRKASIWIRVPAIQGEIDESFWPLLGSSIGSLVGEQIPVISGLETSNPSKDDLKAFGAAFATSCSAPMFHMVGVTPEAKSIEAISPLTNELNPHDFSWQLVQSCWSEFNGISAGEKVDLISLGNPHFSLREIRLLAELCKEKTKHNDVEIVVTCGRSTHGLASQAGLIEQLEQFGVIFIRDTCWCMIIEPIIPRHSRVIMTNSGKYAHYGPGLTGRQFAFGSVAMCVETACSGTYSGEMPTWLKSVS